MHLPHWPLPLPALLQVGAGRGVFALPPCPTKVRVYWVSFEGKTDETLSRWKALSFPIENVFIKNTSKPGGE